MKQTPWFDGSQKPVRDGVFKRKAPSGKKVWSRWADGEWKSNWTWFPYADEECRSSVYQCLPWCGLLNQCQLCGANVNESPCWLDK